MSPSANQFRTGMGRNFRFGPQAGAARRAAADSEKSGSAQQSTKAHQRPQTSPQSSAGLLIQPPSTPVGHKVNPKSSQHLSKAVPTGRERIIRQNISQRDILITATTITKNRVHQAEFRFPDGTTRFVDTTKFDNDKSNFPKEYKAMTSEEKEAFFKDQWVDIMVDIDAVKSAVEAEANVPSVLDMMAKLGPELYACPRVFINLIFSKRPLDDQSITFVGPEAQADPIDSRTPAIDFMASPTLSYLVPLVDTLQNFKSLKSVAIVFRLLENADNKVSWGQLQHALPFYGLNFVNWRLLVHPKNPGPRALYVHDTSITLLNQEYAKIYKIQQQEERLRQQQQPRMEWGVTRTTISDFKKDW